MTTTAVLGWRLVRAGGWLRAVSIALGAAVASVLTLAALAIPTAVYPPGEGMDGVWRANVSGALLFALTPAVVLLITTSRISSATRDRRLASLRMIGMGRADAAAVAAVEAGLPTAAGAGLGGAAFVGFGPLLDRVVAAGPGWFASPLRLPAGPLLVVLAGVIAVGVVIAAAPQLRDTSPLRERSAASRRRPSRWRLAVPAAGAVLLGWLVAAGESSARWGSNRLVATLVGGAVLAAVGIAVATPVLADRGAALLLRTRRTPAVLAARGIQAEPLGTTRLVAGLAVTLYLVLGGSAVLLAFESTPQYRSALQAVGEGPQHLTVAGGDVEEYAPVTLDPTDLSAVEAALSQLPGVLMVTPTYEVQLAGCEPDFPDCYQQFFVGTCTELGALMTVTGCSDDHPAFITVTNPSDPDELWVPQPPAGYPQVPVTVTGGGDLTITLGPDLVQDIAATEQRWVYQEGISVFVPERVIEATGAGARTLEVVAVGGTQIREQIAAALPSGTYLQPTFNDIELTVVARVRLVIYTLSAMAIGTALLGLTLTTIDHARERRVTTARQLAVGVPPRTLYTGQLLQALLPLLGAVALATVLGWLLVRAWAAASGWPPLADRTTVALIALTTASGAGLAALASLPAARTRLTASLLRRE